MTSMTMQTSVGTLVVETERIDVTTALPTLDPLWRYTDQQGHPHYASKGGETFPTLVKVVDSRWWCADCNDEHTDTHLECRLCGETIKPGTRVSEGSTYAPGMTSYTLDGVPISEDRAKEIIDEMRRNGRADYRLLRHG